MLPLLKPDPRQHEGELAHLEEAESHRQRHDVDIAEAAGDDAEDQRLARTHHQHQQHDETQVGPQEGRVEQHAHRREEEQAEEIAQGDHVAQRLVAVVRFAEDDAGHEGAEGKGEPDQVGGVADAQPQRGHSEQEELARVPAAHHAHEPRNDPRANDEHRGQEEHRTYCRPGQLRQTALQIAQLGQDDHEWHHGQVLDDEHADHDPAREGAHTSLVDQCLQRDHGAGERNGRTEPD